MGSSSVNIHISLVHKLNTHDVEVPAATTFGQLRDLAAQKTGIDNHHLKLLFRGRECQDGDILLTAGVKNGAKVSVVETRAYREEQADAMATQQANAALQQQEGSEQAGMRGKLAPIRLQVDGLQAQALELQHNPMVPDARKKATILVELLTQKLISLDNVEVSGDAKMLRKQEINRINSLCDELESLKSRLPQ